MCTVFWLHTYTRPSHIDINSKYVMFQSYAHETDNKYAKTYTLRQQPDDGTDTVWRHAELLDIMQWKRWLHPTAHDCYRNETQWTTWLPGRVHYIMALRATAAAFFIATEAVTWRGCIASLTGMSDRRSVAWLWCRLLALLLLICITAGKHACIFLK